MQLHLFARKLGIYQVFMPSTFESSFDSLVSKSLELASAWLERAAQTTWAAAYNLRRLIQILLTV